MATSFKRAHACTAALSAPDPAAGHCRLTPLLETPGHSRASLGQSLVGSLLFSPGSRCTQDFVCALQESVSPILCKLWWLYGRVNGDLLQEGLCHTQVCCIQSPCPCGRPLLICTSAGDTQIQFLLSLCGVSGSWCAQGLFDPSERLWQIWSLILKVISPLLLPCWDFSFALGCGASFFLTRSNIILLTVVQQRVVILEFLQEKMSAHRFTPPSAILGIINCVCVYLCVSNVEIIFIMIKTF